MFAHNPRTFWKRKRHDKVLNPGCTVRLTVVAKINIRVEVIASGKFTWPVDFRLRIRIRTDLMKSTTAIPDEIVAVDE